ncbi:MAG: hypothetical protein FJ088_02430 [Deltaproteobacteria bacterium]|nr:hypothetical protein [Deltaproteobacteria bacterium]
MDFRRKFYFINVSFQVKYIIIMIALSLLIFLTLGFLYFNALETQQKLMGLSKISESIEGGLSESDREFEEELKKKAWEKDRMKLIILCAKLIMLVAAMTALSIFITHRAAGPVFAVSKFLENASRGEWGSIRPLRKKDDFVFLYDSLVGLRDALKRENDDEIGRLEAAIGKLESSDAQDENKSPIIEEIRGLIEKKKNKFT